MRKKSERSRKKSVKKDALSTYYRRLLAGQSGCVDRQARKRAPSTTIEKEGNCFVGGSLQAVGQLADTLCAERITGQLAAVRRAAYDIAKLRGKRFVERVGTTRRYRPHLRGLRTLAALLILREKVIKPVIAGAGRPRVGRPPKALHPLDQHYISLQRELRATFETLKLAA